jgi:type IV secretory pathway VirB10-like protein
VMVVSFAFNTPRTSADAGYGDVATAEEMGGDAARRNYLASPPDTGQVSRLGAATATDRSTVGATALDQVGIPAGTSGEFDPLAGEYPYDLYAGSAYPSQPWGQELAPAPPEEPSPRELAFERAIRCGIRSCPSEANASPAMPNPLGAGFDVGAVALPTASFAEEGPTPAQPTSPPRDRYNAFRESFSEANESPYVAARVERPVSPYQIMAGTLIPVTLVTAINSDLPGEVVAQVTRNVYDTQQRHLLIPAGSKVLGRVDNQVGLGQARVNIAWHRLVLPNNNSLALPGFGGVDGQGAAGIRDRVNNHYTRTYMNALLLSAITAGAQLSQPQSANVYAAPSAGQVAAGALGQRMSEVSSEVIRGNMQVGPTLEVRPGFKFSIYVSRDLILPPYDHYGDR